MAIIRWQRPEATAWRPIEEELSRLREEMNLLFQFPVAGMQSQFFTEWAPAIDLYQDKDNMIVRTELPGMKKEEIDISLHGDVLTISGERKAGREYKEADNYRAERFFGRFQRSVTLPSSVDAGKVKASYRDGILTVTLPKTEESKPKQIAVSVK